MLLSVSDLNKRSLDVFKEIIDAYIETGEPVGSRTLSRRLNHPLSPATIRNVMADLEEAGLLYAPHTSAGRLPTEAGLRFFVDGLLEKSDIGPDDREEIEKRCQFKGLSVDSVLEEASSMLAGLSSCAGLVLAPKMNAPLKHIEFIPLSSGRVLVILVAMDGTVENRIVVLDEKITSSVLTEAAEYINSRIYGRTLEDARALIEQELLGQRDHLDALTSHIVEMGLGVWAGDEGQGQHNSALIVKGQSKLIDTIEEIHELENIRSLFRVLDTKETLLKLINTSIQADSVQIFIGAENGLFQLSGCSLVVAPYRNGDQKIIGAIGVIGSSRMNYRRIIPLVDYTAKMVGKIIG